MRPGKLADILVVDGDPLQNIGVLRDRGKIKLIMKGGEAFKNLIATREPQPVSS